MANWILVGMKIGVVVVGLGAFISAMVAAFASLATVPEYADEYSNGKLSIPADILYIVGAVLTIPMFFIALFSLIAQLACKRMFETKIKMMGIIHIVILVLALLPFLFFPIGLILACGTISYETNEYGVEVPVYTPSHRPKDAETKLKEAEEWKAKSPVEQAQEITDKAERRHNALRRVFGKISKCGGVLYDWDDVRTGGIFRKGKDGKGKGKGRSLVDAYTQKIRDEYLAERKECCLTGWRMPAVIVYMLAALIVMALTVVVFIFTKKEAKRMQQDALQASQAQEQQYYENQPQPQYDPQQQYQEGQQGESYSVAPEGEVAA